jgi:hypothetical protein
MNSLTDCNLSQNPSRPSVFARVINQNAKFMINPREAILTVGTVMNILSRMIASCVQAGGA